MATVTFPPGVSPGPTYWADLGVLLRQPAEIHDALLRIIREASDPENAQLPTSVLEKHPDADLVVVQNAVPLLRFMLKRTEQDEGFSGLDFVDALRRIAPQNIHEDLDTHHEFIARAIEGLLERRGDLAITDLRDRHFPAAIRTMWTVSLDAATDGSEVFGFLPSIRLDIATNDPHNPHFHLQFDEDTLKQFIDDLNDAASELRAIRAHVSSLLKLGGPYQISAETQQSQDGDE